MIRISDIKIRIDRVADSDAERQALQDIIVSTLKIREKNLLDFIIFKKSIWLNG